MQFILCLIQHSIYSLPYSTFNLFSALFNIQFILGLIQHSIYSLPCSTFNLFSALFNIQIILCLIKHSIYSLPCSTFNLFSALFNIQIILCVIKRSIYSLPYLGLRQQCHQICWNWSGVSGCTPSSYCPYKVSYSLWNVGRHVTWGWGGGIKITMLHTKTQSRHSSTLIQDTWKNCFCPDYHRAIPLIRHNTWWNIITYQSFFAQNTQVKHAFIKQY